MNQQERKTIEFIPVGCPIFSLVQRAHQPSENTQTLFRKPPPTKYMGKEDGRDFYSWYITEDEYFRLNKIFGRDFQETGMGATFVHGLPTPCKGCGKYTEFIDW